MRLTGARILMECLRAEGVEVFFGYPGGVVLPLYNTLGEYPDIKHVLVRHEQAAAHAADGYARVAGRTGVCLATSGPGRDQSRDRHHHRLHGLGADGRADRQRRPRPDRPRRLPGSRYHRHHPADHQAQLPADARLGDRAGGQGGLPHRLDRAQGSGAGRHSQGCLHRRGRVGRLPAGRLAARLPDHGRASRRRGGSGRRRPSTRPRSRSSSPDTASSSPRRRRSWSSSPSARIRRC